MEQVYLGIVLAPLAAAIVTGLFGKQVGRAGAHWITNVGVGIATVLSFFVLYQSVFKAMPVYNETVYTWMVSDGIRFEIGFLVDRLTALLMAVVTFISFMVKSLLLFSALFAFSLRTLRYLSLSFC